MVARLGEGDIGSGDGAFGSVAIFGADVVAHKIGSVDVDIASMFGKGETVVGEAGEIVHLQICGYRSRERQVDVAVAVGELAGICSRSCGRRFGSLKLILSVDEDDFLGLLIVAIFVDKICRYSRRGICNSSSSVTSTKE